MILHNHLTAAGSVTYGYDNDGNRTSVTNGTTTSYGFDYEDRLTSIGSSVSYDYIGAATDRYSKTVSGTTTQFLYDAGNVDEELQGSTETAEYGAYAQKQGSSVYWELHDGQPSTRQLLNSSQSVVASYITDAYGNSVSSSGSATNPFQWNGASGYYSDTESGLQKVGARYYDPSVGRWVSQDTLLVAGDPSDSQAVNRYVYCGSNPVDRTDSVGRRVDWKLVGQGEDSIRTGQWMLGAAAGAAAGAAFMLGMAARFFLAARLALTLAAGFLIIPEASAALAAMAGALATLAAGFAAAAVALLAAAAALWIGGETFIQNGQAEVREGYAGQ